MILPSDIQAVAAAASRAVSATAWVWHTSRKAWDWRKRRALIRERQQRDAVLNVVIPACAVTLVVALILASHIGSR